MDDDYIVIDTPELKALYGPMRHGDGFMDLMGQWRTCGVPSVDYQHVAFRRLRKYAWLAVAEHPVQFQLWPTWLMHKDGYVEWFAIGSTRAAGDVTWWQPGPMVPFNAEKNALDHAFKQSFFHGLPIPFHEEIFTLGWNAAMAHRRRDPIK